MDDNGKYALSISYARKGYMRESMKIMLPFLFDQMKLNRIQAFTLPENSSSRNLLVKLKFEEEGLIRNCMKINDVWRYHLLYSKLAKEYLTL